MRIVASLSALTAKSALIGVVLAGGAFQSVAFADDLIQEKAVHFDDLNLDRPAGAEALYRRIRSAAREVCQTPVYSKNWSALEERACFESAVDRAVKIVGAPQLTRVHGDHLLRLARR
jgi:UrcA family protein